MIIENETLGYVILPEVRMRSVRTDTNKVLFDFSLLDFQANMTLNLDEMLYPSFDYNIRFNDVKVNQRGVRVKAERDVWQLTGFFNNGAGMVNDYLRGNFHPKYVLGITNRAAELKWDNEL